MSATPSRRRRAQPAAEPESARPVRDRRFYELLDLAREGDICAIAELWNRYSYHFPEAEL